MSAAVPPLASARRPLLNAETALLCLFAIALPLVEAPKNIFWALFLLAWFANSIRLRNFGRLEPHWNILFGAMIVAPALSLALSPFTPQWKEMGDIVGYVSLAWMLGRSQTTPRQTYLLMASLIGATLLGVVHGYWVLSHDPQRIWLQLNSVGHVNHSAIYASGIGLLALAGAIRFRQASGWRARTLLTLPALLMFGAMIGFASRSALLGYAAGAVALLLLQSKLRVRHYAALCGLLVLVGGGAQLLTNHLTGERNPYGTVLTKTVTGLRGGSISSYRGPLWQVALEGFRQSPLTGVGAASFGELNAERIKAWVEARGERFDASRYYFTVHGHGLYANTLGERGLIGLAVALALMLAWLYALARHRPPRDASLADGIRWGAAVGAWCMVFVGGLFNTTLHHEHGMLAMVLLGLMLGSCPLRPVSSKAHP